VARKTKTLSARNIVKPGRAPLVTALEEMRVGQLRTFDQAEAIYLNAMQDFDALVSAGIADQGDLRNG
jgi:hypothetical protein